MKLTVTTAVSTIAVAMVAFSQTAQAQSTCAAQTVFDLCKQNEDNYIKTCNQGDYACLCKWQKAKVSCWDTCPNDTERGTQEALMTTYCSQPGANVSNILPSTSLASISQSASSTPSPSASESNGESAGSSLVAEGNVGYVASTIVALVAGYMLQ
ncbi:hypothetical protein BDB00DRAFT_592000 [Zychaea mexicana]|uniref:uncharacterized protein n=1 Tax=Zychaea mexicana TaxID=64656 RepID=UPI0022FDF165|nr:uncharacterized protein BDB00DRAFT_592000 [Zychaea mexicana]KAI9497783.1 hypothetical protein BDB00DRAFT_592000 [Zychaea mexicana]